MLPTERKKDKRTHARVAKIESVLSVESLDVYELAKKTAGCLGVTRRFVSHLHQHKAIHVSGWSIHMTANRPYGVLSPRYSWGNAPDAVPVSVLVENRDG